MRKSSVKCSACKHRPAGIFCDLVGAHLSLLEGKKVVHRYQRGQTIFYEGNPVFAIYCIYAGLVKLYKTNKKGDRHIIRLLGPGEITGYRALLADEPYAATAEAVESTTVCTIPKEIILDLLKESPQVAMRLLAKMAHELRTSEEQMLALAQESVRERTAQMLLFLMKNSSRRAPAPTSLTVPLYRSEMAQMIGTTPETFSRTLHQFAQRDILKLTRSTIYIQNLPGLQRLASGFIGPT